MTALSAARIATERMGKDPLATMLGVKMAASTTIYAGGLVCVNASGYAVPATTTAGFRVVGVAQETKTNSGSNGAATIEVRRGPHKFVINSTDITQAHLFKQAYVVDDQTVSNTGNVIAGRIVQVDSDGVWIEVGVSDDTGVEESQLLTVTLTAAAEASNAIVVSGVVKNADGTAVTAAKQVMVRTLSVTADKGDITVVTGTEKKAFAPSTGENVTWLETTSAGLFSVSVANDAAEVTLIQATPEGGIPALLKLTFA